MTREVGSLIDCDVHPRLPQMRDLLPYLDEYWRHVVTVRGIDGLVLSGETSSAPHACRSDWRSDGYFQSDRVGSLQRNTLDRWNLKHAICNCLHGSVALFNEDLSAALVRAVNDWMVAEILNKDPRLKGSILVPVRNPNLAAGEIDRCAKDQRFIQILLPLMAECTLGRRSLWPIYEAAVRHNLPVAIHSGSIGHHPTTPVGWPSTFAEDYIAQSFGAQGQLLSLIAEGVFSKFPTLKVVFTESGFTWLPAFLWRANKYWRSLRLEVPWVERSPSEIVATNVRFTLRPTDFPGDTMTVNRIIDQIESDKVILFSSDYPHWHFDDDDLIPAGMSDELIQRIAIQNPVDTYSRLSTT
jgi:predicted TIM-barrel fold metal-dependent hydrolase